MKNLFLELEELLGLEACIDLSLCLSTELKETQIHSDIWHRNYVITISGEGGFSADNKKYITEIKFSDFKHGMSWNKSQCSPYSCSLTEKLQSVKISTFI